jgi:NADH-quinone oxidoreductase subunit L
VIHALSGEQNIWKMGGLRRRLPLTHATFLVAVLAIAGIPPFAGFFSKDGILAGVLESAGESGSGLLFALWTAGVLTAGITAFYMTRLYLLVFAGEPRMSEETRDHLHESPAVMTVPLAVLAAGSALAGLLGIPAFLGGGAVPNLFEDYLSPVLVHRQAEPMLMAVPSEWTALGLTLAVSFAGIAMAWSRYGRRPAPVSPAAEPRGLARAARDKFYVDEMIGAVVLRPYDALCRIAAAIDERIVDGLVNAAGATADLASQMLRLIQTGYVRNYAFVFFAATILILLYVLR